jgi:hypothetical protein
MQNIGKYFLDLNKVNKIENMEERDRIHNYYRDMLHSFHENMIHVGQSYYNTLVKSGYLLDFEQERRDEKLNEVLDGN